MPFVGREAELAQLAGIVETCRESGRGRAVVIRGEAGIGKTRLVEEFTRIAAANGFKVHRGLVLDFGVGEGRDAIRAVVQSLLDIPSGSERSDAAGCRRRSNCRADFWRRSGASFSMTCLTLPSRRRNSPSMMR